MVGLVGVRILVALALAESPFGDCDEAAFLSAQMEIVRECKVPRPRCDARTTCERANRTAMELHRCSHAKRQLMTKCFDWGTPKQKQEYEALQADRLRCYDVVIEHVCRRDPTGQLAENEEPEPFPPFVGAAQPAKLEPPGDCSRAMFRELNSKVGEMCKQFPMTCTEPGLSCDELRLRVQRFEACIAARRVLMDVCFRGGDANHVRVVEQLAAGRAHCAALLLVRCRPSPHCPPD